MFFIISGNYEAPKFYGPVVENEWMSYTPHHYEVMQQDEYKLDDPVDDIITEGHKTVDVFTEESLYSHSK